MGGSVPEGLLFTIKADVEKAVAGLRSFDTAVDKTKSKTKNVFGEVTNQYKAMVQSSRLLGENADLTSKKMAFLGDAIKKGMSSGNLSKANITTLVSMRETVKQNATGFEKLKMSIGRVGESIGVSGLGSSLTTMGLALGAAAIAAKALISVVKTGLDFNMMIEKNTVAIRVMTGSIEKTIQLTGQMQKLVQETPATMDEAFSGAKQLLAYGFGTDNLVDNMRMLSTVAGAVGIRLSDLTYVYGTLRSQGRAYVRDLMQFAMRGIPIYEELGRVLGVSTAEVKKMTEAGGVGFAEVEKAFKNMTGSGGRFAGMLEAQMNTLSGQLDIASKNTKIFAGILTKDLASAITSVLKPLNAFTTLIIKSSQNSDNLRTLAETLGGLGLVWEAVTVNPFGKASVEAERMLPILDAQLAKLQESGSISAKQLKTYQDQLAVVRGMADLQAPDVKGSIDTTMRQRGFGGKGLPEDIKNKGANKIAADFAIAMREGNGDILKTTQAVQNVFKLGWKDSLDMVAFYMKTSREQYEAVLAEEGKASRTFFQQFQQMTGEVFAKTDYSTASAGFSQVFQTFEKDFDATKKLISGGVFGKESSDKAIEQFNTALGSIEERYLGAIEKMSANPLFGTAKQDSEEYKFLQMFIQRYKELVAMKKEKGKAAKEDSFWKEYEALRATLDLQKETYGVEVAMVLANSYIVRGKTEEAAKMDAILNKYQAMREEAFKLTENGEKQARLTAIELMQEKDISNLLVEKYRKMESMANTRLSMETAYVNALKIQTEIYDYKLLIINETLTGEERTIALKKAELDLEKALTAEGVKRYQVLTEGSSEYWDKLKEQMANQQAAGDVTGMAQTGMAQGTQGSQVGSMMAGADPITMIITEFVKMLASLENFGKLLNPISVVMEGLRPVMVMIDKALKPIVVLLEIVGEIVGDLIAPILEVIFDLFGDVASILIPIIKALRPLFQVIGQLAAFLFELCNPIIMIIDILADLYGASEAEVKSKEEQLKEMQALFDKELKSLQDLYNVGAISGKEYEARLAAMQRPGEVVVGGESELAGMMREMIDAMKLLIYPILKVIADIVGGLIGGLMGVISGITGFVGGFANIITGIFTGNGDLVMKGLKMMILGVAGILAGLVDGIVINPINAVLNGLKGIDILGVKPFGWVTTIGTLTSLVQNAMNSLAVGTSMVPEDMVANIHKGEMVVPAKFAASLRSGDLTLSGKNGYNSAPAINVYVTGSVISERDLVKTIFAETQKLGRKGYL